MRLFIRRSTLCTLSKTSVLGRGVELFTTGNPFWGTNLLEVSIGRDLGALEGLSEDPHKKQHQVHPHLVAFGLRDCHALFCLERVVGKTQTR